MLTSINPISLTRVIHFRNIWKNALRTCQTTAVVDSGTPEKENVSSDPDMFISDINNPFEKKKAVCIICKYKIPLDYRLLSQFVSPYTGFIYDKHITGLCDAQQKRLRIAIKRSQDSGFMAKEIKVAKYLKDPKLFDPFSPSRPNPH